MKHIAYLLLLAMSFAFTACTNDEPFSTATADDEPRILDPIFPDREKGALPTVATIGRDGNLNMTLTVTPADHTTILWQIDGHEVATGRTIDLPLKAGTYSFKVMVSTPSGRSTYREGIVQVNPLAEDPQTTSRGNERIIAPAAKARLYGEHLDKVKSLVVGQTVVTGLVYLEAEACLEYTVPATLTDGNYRIILVDADGNEYGGNRVQAFTTPLIVTGADRANANREWSMTGLNLDKVAALMVNGQRIETFIRRSATELAITCPQLEDGEYTLTGITTDGQELQFYNGGEPTTGHTVIVSSITVLWQGHHYVSWELEDGNPNKMFTFLSKELFATFKAGATLSIHYSIEPSAVYHQLRTTTAQWTDLPGTAVIEFSTDGVKEVTLTQEVLDLIQAQDGFLCVGHGYYVDLVTIL